MSRFSLNDFCKQLCLLVPAVRRFYNLSLELKSENDSLREAQRVCRDISNVKVNLTNNPHDALTRDLPQDRDEQYFQLEKRILLILGSKELMLLPIDLQINWIREIFAQCISRHHPKSVIFAQLIDDLLPSIFQDKGLSLVSACHLYDAMYGLYWCGAQSLMDMRGFDFHTVRLFREFLASREELVARNGQMTAHGGDEIRVAYFCHYAYETKGNALAPVVAALANGHAKNKNRKIYIYCVQWSSQEFIDSFEGTGIVVRNFPNQADYNQLEKLVESIRKDGIDVIITEVASSIANYVFGRRAAPCQIWLEPGYPFWSNPDVDWVLVPGKVWQPWFGISNNKHSKLKLALPQRSDAVFPSADEFEKAKLRLPTDKKIFSVFTRLIKITPAYLDALRRILIQLPNACMLFVGAGDSRLIDNLKLDASFRGRVFLINENVDLNVYGRLIDVFLDTFPFVGGLACRDVASLGKPVLSLLAGEWDVLLKEERIPSLLAKDIDEYVNTAIRLIRDGGFKYEVQHGLRTGETLGTEF